MVDSSTGSRLKPGPMWKSLTDRPFSVEMSTTHVVRPLQTDESATTTMTRVPSGAVGTPPSGFAALLSAPNGRWAPLGACVRPRSRVRTLETDSGARDGMDVGHRLDAGHSHLPGRLIDRIGSSPGLEPRNEADWRAKGVCWSTSRPNRGSSQAGGARQGPIRRVRSRSRPLAHRPPSKGRGQTDVGHRHPDRSSGRTGRTTPNREDHAETLGSRWSRIAWVHAQGRWHT